MRGSALALATIVFLTVTLIVGLYSWPASKADEPKPKSWSHVQVVSYASGLTGFFDTRTGRYYLYDSNLEKPILVREIDELGKPMKKVQN